MTDLTNEELIEFLEQAEELEKQGKIRKIKNKNFSSVERFISDKKIVTGLDKVPTYVIYYLYRMHWSDKYKEKKVNKIVFFRVFNKLFTQVRTGKQRYYLLNKESFDLSRTGLIKAKGFSNG